MSVGSRSSAWTGIFISAEDLKCVCETNTTPIASEKGLKNILDKINKEKDKSSIDICNVEIDDGA